MVVEKNDHITERFVDNHYKTPNRLDDIQAAAVDYVTESPQKVNAAVLKKVISNRFKMSTRKPAVSSVNWWPMVSCPTPMSLAPVT